jgi:quinol monooxygenase YgiN
MIVVQGEVRVHPDDMAKVREMGAAFVRANRAEAGCLGYGLGEDLMEPGLVHIVERWRDQPALDAHRAAPHVAAFQAELPKLRILGLRIVDYEADEGRVAMGA